MRTVMGDPGLDPRGGAFRLAKMSCNCAKKKKKTKQKNP